MLQVNSHTIGIYDRGVAVASQAPEVEWQRPRLKIGLVSLSVRSPLPADHVACTSPPGVRAQRGTAAPRRPLHVTAAAAADSGSWSEAPGATPSDGAASSGSSRSAPAGFASLERLLASQMGGGPGGDWREVEGCYVLYPPEGAPPRCLIEFIGGSFVGAAPQLAYRPLLEALAARGALVRPGTGLLVSRAARGASWAPRWQQDKAVLPTR